MAGESEEPVRTTVREAEAEGVEMAEEVKAQVNDMEEYAVEGTEEDMVAEDQPWLMASIFLTSPNPSRITNRPLSPARIGATSMRSVNIGAPRMTKDL